MIAAMMEQQNLGLPTTCHFTFYRGIGSSNGIVPGTRFISVGGGLDTRGGEPLEASMQQPQLLLWKNKLASTLKSRAREVRSLWTFFLGIE